MPSAQTELQFVRIAPDDPDVDWFVKLVGQYEWITAAEVLRAANRPVDEEAKRWPRALRKAANGRVIGHQKGYRLTMKMTAAQYNSWRNTAMSQARELHEDVAAADAVFYNRQPIPS